MSTKKMGRRDLKKQLEERFQGKIHEFHQKRATYGEELMKDLSNLKAAYGDDLVNASLGPNPAIVRIVPSGGTIRETKVPARTPAVEPTSETPKKRQKRKGSRRKRVGGAIRFTDLQPHVLEAVKGLGSARFSGEDVRKALKGRKVIFAPEHVSLILTKYMSGVSVVEKHKVKGVSGPPRNIYQVKGTPTLIKFSRVVKKK